MSQLNGSRRRNTADISDREQLTNPELSASNQRRPNVNCDERTGGQGRGGNNAARYAARDADTLADEHAARVNRRFLIAGLATGCFTVLVTIALLTSLFIATAQAPQFSPPDLFDSKHEPAPRKIIRSLPIEMPDYLHDEMLKVCTDRTQKGEGEKATAETKTTKCENKNIEQSKDDERENQVQPVLYDLLLDPVYTKCNGKRCYRGALNLKIFIPGSNTKSIGLHMNKDFIKSRPEHVYKTTNEMPEMSVSLYECDKKKALNSFLKSTNITFANGLMELKLGEPLKRKTFYVLHIREFFGPLYSASKHSNWLRGKDSLTHDSKQAGLFAQINDRDQTQPVVGIRSMFPLRRARNVFPCMDEHGSNSGEKPSGRKARFRLRLKHSAKETAYSIGEVKKKKECKKKPCYMTEFYITPPMHPSQFWFFTSSVPSIKPQSKHSQIQIEICLESAVTLKKNKLEHLVNTTNWAMSDIQTKAKIRFPLKNLTMLIVRDEITKFGGMGSFGLIVLSKKDVNDSFTKKDIFPRAEPIFRQVLGQWIGGIVSRKGWTDICIQEGFIGYFTLQLLTQNITDGKVVFESELRKLRDKALNFPEPLRKDFANVAEIGQTCGSGRGELIFAMMDLFDANLSQRIFDNLLDHCRYPSIDYDGWYSMISDDQHLISTSQSPENILKDHFVQGGYQIFYVEKSSDDENGNGMEWKFKSSTEPHNLTYAVPVFIHENWGIRKGNIHSIQYSPSGNSFEIDAPSNFVLSRNLYAVDKYNAVIECLRSKNCPFINASSVTRLLGDFCYIRSEAKIFSKLTNCTGTNEWNKLANQIKNSQTNKTECKSLDFTSPKECNSK